MNKDMVTANIKRALDTLFVANPAGTSLGFLFGVILQGLLQFLEPTLSHFEAVRFSAIGLWHTCATGVVAFNIRPYLRRSKINPKITEALDFIESEAKRGNMPVWQRRRMYENLIAKVLANVVLDSPTQKELNAIRASMSKGESGK